MLVILLVAGVLVLALQMTGRLGHLSLDDAIGASLFLLGIRFLTTGQSLSGALLMGGGVLYAGYRRGRFSPRGSPMPLEDAERLLGLGTDASLVEIRAAHRRLIARVHPDTGGSAELASRINAARDALVADRTSAGGRRRDPLR